MSRRDSYNADDYTRQKHVATEVCGFAKKHNVLVYSATQTNRSGAGAQRFNHDDGIKMIELNQAAESYGKTMPVDYVISLNQSIADRNADMPCVHMFIAKNREGPRLITVDCTVNYETMKVFETPI